jgi:hypothetical protein
MPEYQFRLLLDARLVDGESPDAEFLRGLAELTRDERPNSGKGRTAYVVTRDVDFGMSRIAQVFYKDLPFEFLVTRSYDEAMEWLTAPEDPRTP